MLCDSASMHICTLSISTDGGGWHGVLGMRGNLVQPVAVLGVEAHWLGVGRHTPSKRGGTKGLQEDKENSPRRHDEIMSDVVNNFIMN